MYIYLCNSNIVKTFFLFLFKITKNILKLKCARLQKYLSWDTEELTFDEVEFLFDFYIEKARM